MLFIGPRNNITEPKVAWLLTKTMHILLSFQWLPTQVVLVYRAVFAVYCLAIWLYEWSNLRGFYFIYLTHWTFILMIAYFTCASVLSACSLMKKRKSPPTADSSNLKKNPDTVSQRSTNDDKRAQLEQETDFELPFLHQGVWLLHSICANASLMITVGYWALLYRGQELDIANVSKHFLNAVFMLLDTSLSFVPVRVFHSVYVIGYVIVYFIFTFMYWVAKGTDEFGHKYIYLPLDYNKIPATALIVISFFFIIVQPVIQAILFGIYRVRSLLYCQLCSKRMHKMLQKQPRDQFYLQPQIQNHIPQRILEDKHIFHNVLRCAKSLRCKIQNIGCSLWQKVTRVLSKHKTA